MDGWKDGLPPVRDAEIQQTGPDTPSGRNMAILSRWPTRWLSGTGAIYIADCRIRYSDIQFIILAKPRDMAEKPDDCGLMCIRDGSDRVGIVIGGTTVPNRRTGPAVPSCASRCWMG